MLDLKQIIKFFIFLLSLQVFAKERSVYSYSNKANLSLSKVNRNLIYIKKGCSACLSLIKTLQDKNIPFHIGLTQEPSFRWLLSLKRNFKGANIVNISGLDLNLYKGSPQLVEFHNNILKHQIYGKKRILKHILSQ